jgi:hypothetical protein
MTKPRTVREFSRCGPCITLGELVERTAKTIKFRTRDGKIERRGGYRLERGLIHTEPCHSCMDSPNTQYPNGYWD